MIDTNVMRTWVKKLTQSQLAIPLFALFLIVIFNVFRDLSFFEVSIRTNNFGNAVLSGNLISMLQNIIDISQERVSFGSGIYPWIAFSEVTISGK